METLGVLICIMHTPIYRNMQYARIQLTNTVTTDQQCLLESMVQNSRARPQEQQETIYAGSWRCRQASFRSSLFYNARLGSLNYT